MIRKIKNYLKILIILVSLLVLFIELTDLTLIEFIDGKTIIYCRHDLVIELDKTILYTSKVIKGVLIDNGSGYPRDQYRYLTVDFTNTLYKMNLYDGWNRVLVDDMDPQYCKYSR